MTLKYKVGDKVQVCVDHYGDDIPKGVILNVVADAQLGAHWITTTEAEVSMCNAYPEEFKLVDVPKEQSPETHPSFRVGDKVKIREAGWGICGDEFHKLREQVFEVEERSEGGYFGDVGYRLKGLANSVTSYYPGDDGFMGEKGLELVSEAPTAQEVVEGAETSNETGDYAAVYTAISFAKVKDKQPYAVDVYDENSTQIEVLNEGNGMFLSITQNGCPYSGESASITLDFDEVEPLFQAIKKLISQPMLKGD